MDTQVTTAQFGPPPVPAVAGRSPERSRYALGHLATLEAEAVYILREVGGQFARPVLLFSGGKDSAVLLSLAEKASRVLAASYFLR